MGEERKMLFSCSLNKESSIFVLVLISYAYWNLTSFSIRDGEGNGNPLQYSCLEIPWTEEPGGLQWVTKDSGRTKRLSMSINIRERTWARFRRPTSLSFMLCWCVTLGKPLDLLASVSSSVKWAWCLILLSKWTGSRLRATCLWVGVCPEHLSSLALVSCRW